MLDTAALDRLDMDPGLFTTSDCPLAFAGVTELAGQVSKTNLEAHAVARI